MKNKKILVVIAIALVCAITAGALIIAFLTPTRTTVYMFKDNYKAGTHLSAEMLTPVQVDKKIVVAGGRANAGSYFVTYDNYTDVVSSGDVLKNDVYKGEAFMTYDLSSKGSTEIEVRMNTASVAVTIPADNITGVTSALRAECNVNVYVTYSSGGTYLLMENMRVLSVASGDNGISGVTLELTNEQANKIINAVNTGYIYLGLVNGEGYVYVDTDSNANSGN